MKTEFSQILGECNLEFSCLLSELIFLPLGNISLYCLCFEDFFENDLMPFLLSLGFSWYIFFFKKFYFIKLEYWNWLCFSYILVVPYLCNTIWSGLLMYPQWGYKKYVPWLSEKRRYSVQERVFFTICQKVRIFSSLGWAPGFMILPPGTSPLCNSSLPTHDVYSWVGCPPLHIQLGWFVRHHWEYQLHED